MSARTNSTAAHPGQNTPNNRGQKRKPAKQVIAPSNNINDGPGPSHHVVTTIGDGRAAPESWYKDASFEDVLDDLSSRFILNLPEEELASPERICFQVEQAHWFFEDFVREEAPSLPSFSLKKFSELFFRHCPLLSEWSSEHERAFERFMKYKNRVPVCGAILLNAGLDKCVLVKGWKASATWGFPKGKINNEEPKASCAVREVLEETGYDCQALLNPEDHIEVAMNDQRMTLYIVPGVSEEVLFLTQTRKEISAIEWVSLTELPTWRKQKVATKKKFYMIAPFVSSLKQWIKLHRDNQARDLAQASVPETTILAAQTQEVITVVATSAVPAALEEAVPRSSALDDLFRQIRLSDVPPTLVHGVSGAKQTLVAGPPTPPPVPLAPDPLMVSLLAKIASSPIHSSLPIIEDSPSPTQPSVLQHHEVEQAAPSSAYLFAPQHPQSMIPPSSHATIPSTDVMLDDKERKRKDLLDKMLNSLHSEMAPATSGPLSVPQMAHNQQHYQLSQPQDLSQITGSHYPHTQAGRSAPPVAFAVAPGFPPQVPFPPVPVPGIHGYAPRPPHPTYIAPSNSGLPSHLPFGAYPPFPPSPMAPSSHLGGIHHPLNDFGRPQQPHQGGQPSPSAPDRILGPPPYPSVSSWPDNPFPGRHGAPIAPAAIMRPPPIPVLVNGNFSSRPIAPGPTYPQVQDTVTAGGLLELLNSGTRVALQRAAGGR